MTDIDATQEKGGARDTELDIAIRIGRIACFIVLALLASSLIFITCLMVKYWGNIGV